MFKKWSGKEGLVMDPVSYWGMPSPTFTALSAVAEANLVN